MSTADPAAKRYLGRLRRELRAVPPPTAQVILEDVRAHIDEATADGRSIDDVLTALGDPAAIAADAGQSDEPASPGRADRSQVILSTAAAVVGLVTATIASFFTPPIVLGGDRAVDEFGLAVTLVAAMPALTVALPLLFPHRWRTLAAATGALIVTIGIALPFTGGLLFVPVALLAWASAAVPAWRRSRRSTLAWRGLAALGVLVPAVATIGGLVSGAILLDLGPLALCVVSVILAVLLLLGRRIGYAIVTVMGATVMVLSLFDPGLLFLAFWWGGGLYLTIGLSGLTRATSRSALSANSSLHRHS